MKFFVSFLWTAIKFSIVPKSKKYFFSNAIDNTASFLHISFHESCNGNLYQKNVQDCDGRKLKSETKYAGLCLARKLPLEAGFLLLFPFHIFACFF
jgi:hypothetical protein